MAFRLGVDAGGTFTDFTLLDTAGAVHTYKVRSNQQDPLDALRRGIADMAQEIGTTEEGLVRACERVIIGTTVGTNAVIERSGPRIALIATRGFRDVLEFRDGKKPDTYNIKMDPPTPLIPRHLRRGVAERVNYRGEVLVPLAREEVREVARYFHREGVQAVAVALLWSMLNPGHEAAIRDILTEEMPGVPVVISSDVLPMIREWERTSATAISAFVYPGLKRFLSELEGYFGENGLTVPLLMMQCNGGCAPVAETLKVPVLTVGSGPAAAPAAAQFFMAQTGDRDVISVDMGGTSFDVCVITGGNPIVTKDARVGDDMALGIPAIDIHSIGAGGGSIAWLDRGGALHVGPRSAGADPGPAAYARGGTQPTVTDAALVLGYLNPASFLGGRAILDPALAAQALEERIARPLGLSVIEAAAGILDLVNFQMVKGIAAVSVERGIDPRGYTLFVGGGAGPVHAGKLAEELSIGRVFIPRLAGVYCSFGLAVTDLVHNLLRTHPMDSNTLDPDTVNRVFAEMEASGRARLKAEGVPEGRMRFVRYADACYVGQVHELMVELPGGAIASAEQLTTPYHEAHERLYTFRLSQNPVRFFHWRVQAVGLLPPFERQEQAAAGQDPSAALGGTREAYSQEAKTLLPTPIYDGARLRHGNIVRGPAIVELPITTVVVFPGHRLTVNRFGDFDYALPGAGGPARF